MDVCIRCESRRECFTLDESQKGERLYCQECIEQIETGEIAMQLSRQAYDKLLLARDQGLTNDTEQDIITTVLEQEIVSYCNHEMQVSFDIYDIVTEQKVC